MNLIPKHLATLLLSTLVLLGSPLDAAVVTANFTAATTVPVTAAGYTASGNTVDITLSFAPPVGTNLTVVQNTGLDFIQGTFDNLAQGQKVNLFFRGITYPFVANYYGGSGNDLVLQWANTRLLAWGDATNGKLGNNSNIASWVPVPVDSTDVLAGKTITSVGAGWGHSLALCSDGTLAAWGYNNLHELGSDSTTSSSIPVLVDRSGVLAGKTVIAIAVKRDQNLALCSDGTLVAWGSNLAGQLGNGSQVQSSGPVAIDQSGVLSGKTIISISCGDEHAMVLCSDGTLAAWGSNYQGELGTTGSASSRVPVLVDRTGVLAGKKVIAISAGGHHNLALCSDGTLAAWGYNLSGQLGNNTTVNSSVPVLVNRTGVLAGKTIVAVSGATTTSLVLTSDGVLAAWGSNASGQLGNNSTTNSSLPVLVDRTGLLAGKSVVAIASGNYHHLAFCADGTLAAWGANESGCLGTISTMSSSVPVPVDTAALKPGERFAPRSQVAGNAHTLAVAVSPPAPQGSTSAATAVSDTTATLNGSVNPSSTSTAVSFQYGLTTAYGASVAATPAIITGTSTVSASATLTDLLSGTTYHYRLVADGPGGVARGADMTFTTSTLARLASLALSDGSLDPGFAPVITRYAATVPSSVDHLTIITVPGTPGASVTVNSAVVVAGAATPINLTEGSNPIAIVVTSADGLVAETYSVLVTRLPQTFRFQTAGQVGASVTNLVATGSTANFELDFAPPTGTNLTVISNTGIRPIAGTFTNLAQGQSVTLSHGGISYSFVANYFGGSGNDLVLQWANTRVLSWGGDSAGESKIPMPVDTTGIFSNKSVIALAAGQYFSLAVCSDGTLAAWGNNASGQLGNNSTVDSKVPVAVVRSGVLANKVVVSVAAAASHSVALCSDGTMAAWGRGDSGQLGNTSVLSSSSVPVAVNTAGVLAGKTVVAVAAGSLHCLALCSDGTLVAWGGNDSGQLGNNSNTKSLVPVAVDRSGLLAGKTVVAIAAGGSHSLALCSDGTLAAWGNNASGELGTNTTVPTSVPVAVTRSGVLSGKIITAVAAGRSHNLVLCSDGSVAAWGWNFFGQLGNNTTLPSTVPIVIDRSGVLAARTITAVAAGESHSLALCVDGTLAAWGDNTSGRLGNNSNTKSTVPVLVNTDSLRPGERFEVATSACGSSHTVALVAMPPPPTATTLPASVTFDTGATLNGSVNAVGADTSVSFEYGMTTDYGTTVAGIPATVSGTETTAASKAISGLIAGTTYHYRVVAANPNGTTRGDDMTFTTTSDNPDGDSYDNLIEYAFNLQPASGAGSPFTIKPSTSPTSRVELSFTRPVGATASVSYSLEYSRALGPATSWIPIPLTTINPRNIDLAAIDDLTERVTVRNFEAREGFVRFRVELDANGDRIIDHISYTGVQGWTESAMELGTRSYNNPYQHEAVFTGTVDATDGVTGQTLRFTTSAGAVDLATLLSPGAAYYLEVSAGTNEGQRFDVVSATGSTVTLATASAVCSDTPPFNTLAGALPATLAGNRIAIHRHWTLDGLFPVGRFLAADDATSADQVQTATVPATSTYWLFSNGGSPKWVRLGDATLADQGPTVLAPGRGMMVLKRGSAAPVLAYGGVRANNFIRPLCAGLNLVGGGWPVIQSATGPGSRQMDVAHGFSGSMDPASADMFSIWKGDATRGDTAYDNYYLYNSGTAPKWVKTGDATLEPCDSAFLFLGDRSVLIQVKNDVHTYTIPNPSPALPLHVATQTAARLQGLTVTDSGLGAASDLIDYAFGLHLDPNNTGQLPQGKLVGDNYVIEFTQPPGVTGITYGAECSATLLPGSWTDVPDSGTGDQHVFSVPLGTDGKLFMRLKVTGPSE